MNKVGRNDPCPCGSGKKYKNCCLNKEREVGREETIYRELIKKLLNIFNEKFSNRIDEIMEIFWGEEHPEFMEFEPEVLKYAEINFKEWLIFDWVVEEEVGTLMDLYLKTSIMPAEEKVVLEKIKEAHLSLYEVEECFPERGMILRDLLSREKYEVAEMKATRSLVKWDILATRLLHLDDKWVMSGSGYLYPLELKEQILKEIKENFRYIKRKTPSITIRDFCKRFGQVFHWIWYRCILIKRDTHLVTSDGEPLLLSQAVYSVKNRDEVLKKLKTVRSFKEVEDGFIWVSNPDGDSVILGSIAVNDKLVLACFSKGRLERGKNLIQKVAGEWVIHLKDIFEHIKLSGFVSDIASVEKREMSPTEYELYRKILREYYEKEWLYSKIPFINNQTPLEAVKTPEGKKKVVELLKLIENREERQRRMGKPYMDPEWLWERLGLKRE